MDEMKTIRPFYEKDHRTKYSDEEMLANGFIGVLNSNKKNGDDEFARKDDCEHVYVFSDEHGEGHVYLKKRPRNFTVTVYKDGKPVTS
jgi:hypothetical protein